MMRNSFLGIFLLLSSFASAQDTSQLRIGINVHAFFSLTADFHVNCRINKWMDVCANGGLAYRPQYGEKIKNTDRSFQGQFILLHLRAYTTEIKSKAGAFIQLGGGLSYSTITEKIFIKSHYNNTFKDSRLYKHIATGVQANVGGFFYPGKHLRVELAFKYSFVRLDGIHPFLEEERYQPGFGRIIDKPDQLKNINFVKTIGMSVAVFYRFYFRKNKSN